MSLILLTSRTCTNVLQAPPAGQIWTWYYYAGSQRIAMRVQGSTNPDENGVFYLLTDHLGSTTVTLNPAGQVVGQMRYKPWGQTRYANGSTPTDYQYTGQKNTDLGIYYYGARFFDPQLGRFLSADTLIPQPGNPLDWDRYSYVRNDPVNATDPTGHSACWDDNANDPGCKSYTPTGYGLRSKASSPKQVSPTTLTEKIKQGDATALVQMLIPSHIGGRLQLEISLGLGMVGLSGSIGINGVYNRNSDELAANIDWALEPGVGIGAGASGTGGALVGWGSSNVRDVTQGYSGIVSGTAAAEVAMAVAVTAPLDIGANGLQLHVDPYSGQVPSTVYVGGGGGGVYAGVGGGINGQTGIFIDLTQYLPWRRQR